MKCKIKVTSNNNALNEATLGFLTLLPSTQRILLVDNFHGNVEAWHYRIYTNHDSQNIGTIKIYFQIETIKMQKSNY